MGLKYAWAIPSLGEEEKEIAKDVVESGWISGTSYWVDNLEKEFCRITRSKYSIAVCNGTAGLIEGLLALKDLGFKMKIAVPTWTYIATVNTANLLGKIQMVDCDKDTFNILYKKIPKLPIIMPVDIGGLSVDYDTLQNLDWNPVIFSDSAEAIGSLYNGNPVGTQAHLHLFSFHATKVVTAGEGGILTTNRKDIYETLRYLNNQGYGEGHKPWDYNHPKIGYNFRMPSIQAAIATEQLKKLPIFLKKREEFAKIYKDIIGNLVGYQKVPLNCKHAYFLFTILVPPKRKDQIIQDLFKEGIQVKAWKPIHMQPPYQHLGYRFPNAEWLYRTNIHLPIHNALTEEDIKYIAEKVKKII